MALTIEFSRRSTTQLQKILEFYDERNGSDAYSRRLLKCLLANLEHLSVLPTASSSSTRNDVRFIVYSPYKATIGISRIYDCFIRIISMGH